MPSCDGEYGWPPDKDGRLVISDSVTSIGAGALKECDGLTAVAIPNSVTSIGSRAFASCTVLTAMVTPDSVTPIGEYYMPLLAAPA